MSDTTDEHVLTLERRGHGLLMGINRPSKRNAFNIEMLMALGRAYEQLEQDDGRGELRDVKGVWIGDASAFPTAPV